MGLIRRWDRRNQRIVEEQNEVTWEEFARHPDHPWLQRYYRAEAVVVIVMCFVGLGLLVIWLIGQIF